MKGSHQEYLIVHLAVDLSCEAANLARGLFVVGLTILKRTAIR